MKLRIGDRIRIVSVPGANAANYYLHPDTRRAYRKLMSRGRSVRICRIDQEGLPWFSFRIQKKNGTWEYHSMCVAPDDDNWILVKHRR